MKDGSGFDRRPFAGELSYYKQKLYYYDERAGDGAAFRRMINKWREQNDLEPIYKEEEEQNKQ
jgi:hypothetical protein